MVSASPCTYNRTRWNIVGTSGVGTSRFTPLNIAKFSACPPGEAINLTPEKVGILWLFRVGVGVIYGGFYGREVARGWGEPELVTCIDRADWETARRSAQTGCGPLFAHFLFYFHNFCLFHEKLITFSLFMVFFKYCLRTNFHSEYFTFCSLKLC